MLQIQRNTTEGLKPTCDSQSMFYVHRFRKCQKLLLSPNPLNFTIQCTILYTSRCIHFMAEKLFVNQPIPRTYWIDV